MADPIACVWKERNTVSASDQHWPLRFFIRQTTRSCGQSFTGSSAGYTSSISRYSGHKTSIRRVSLVAALGRRSAMVGLYTEYNVGHFSRAFTLSSKIDQQQISAQLEDGVLTLTLKKMREAMARKIAIG